MSSIQLDKISDLVCGPSGLWCSDRNQEVSFPSDGNESRRLVEEQSFWYVHRNECITRAIRNHPPKGPIFDVGGGNGTVSVSIQKAGFDSVLLEPEMAGALEAQRKGLKTVINSTFDAANFRKDSVPAIGLFDILEHIEDDFGFLVSMRDSLMDEGKVYITVPALQKLWSESDDDAGHYRRYRIDQLRSLFERAGFRVLYVSYFFSLLVLPIYLFRSLPYVLKVRRSDKNWRHGHHRSRRSAIGSILLRGMHWEAGRIKNERVVPFGSSCILVAEKNRNA